MVKWLRGVEIMLAVMIIKSKVSHEDEVDDDGHDNDNGGLDINDDNDANNGGSMSKTDRDDNANGSGGNSDDDRGADGNGVLEI